MKHDGANNTVKVKMQTSLTVCDVSVVTTVIEKFHNATNIPQISITQNTDREISFYVDQKRAMDFLNSFLYISDGRTNTTHIRIDGVNEIKYPIR